MEDTQGIVEKVKVRFSTDAFAFFRTKNGMKSSGNCASAIKWQ
jgi:hypothetical protein